MKEKISMNDGEGMGSVIRRLRMEREWTQEELAARIRVSSQAVSKWETGQSLPDISQVPTLARTFGVTTDELFGIESLPNDRPELDFSGYDPEKAWEDWQALRDRIEEYEGIDGWIWSYVYVGYQLCCPDTLLYHPDHASEVREETLRYAESRAKRMEKSRAWGHSFRNLLMELYALSGNYKKACELAAKTPPFLTSSAMNMATIFWDMGRWDGVADQLPRVGTEAANHLLDILALSAEASLRLGRAADALDAAEFGIALIGLLQGAAGLQRDVGDLCQLGTRAVLQLEGPESAMQWLQQLLKEPMQPGSLVRRAFYVGRVGGTAVNPGLRRALLLRSLDHPDLAPLREEPRFRELRAWAEALGEENQAAT